MNLLPNLNYLFTRIVQQCDEKLLKTVGKTHGHIKQFCKSKQFFTDSKEKQPENRNSQEPPSKESSQPNSLTSSSISTDSKPSESREEKVEDVKEEEKKEKYVEESVVPPESIATDA